MVVVKYVTALVPLLAFLLIDLLIVVAFCIVIGVMIALEDKRWPYSYTFAQKIWV